MKYTINPLCNNVVNPTFDNIHFPSLFNTTFHFYAEKKTNDEMYVETDMSDKTEVNNLIKKAETFFNEGGDYMFY